MADVPKPRPNKPRGMALDLADVLRVVQAAPRECQDLFTVMYGPGIEASVAPAASFGAMSTPSIEMFRRRHQDALRNGMLRVAEWAWPSVERLVAGKLPNAPIFDVRDPSVASNVHRAVCHAVDVVGYHLRDARHH